MNERPVFMWIYRPIKNVLDVIIFDVFLKPSLKNTNVALKDFHVRRKFLL